MLRMPPFQVHHPRTAEVAVSLLHSLPDAMFIAGGTDLLPNLKHQLHAPKHLISLEQVEGLGGFRQDPDGSWFIGAGTTLHQLASHPQLAAALPGLSQAAASVAGPQHRRMGTLGGNIMLDTRCLYYNQSQSWRQALGFCLKKDGVHCHVIGSGTACVAAHSADTPPLLLACDARLSLYGRQGPRELPLAQLYQRDGRFERNRSPTQGELLLGVRIPALPSGHRSVYHKVRARAAIDFPQLGLALCAVFNDDGIVSALTGVVSAVMPQPKLLKRLDVAIGTRLDPDTIEALAEAIFRQVKPQRSIHGDPSWRREMARVTARRALQDLREM